MRKKLTPSLAVGCEVFQWWSQTLLCLDLFLQAAIHREYTGNDPERRIIEGCIIFSSPSGRT